MNLFKKVKEIITNIKNKVKDTKQNIEDFVKEHKEQIAQAMKLADLAYDNFEGSLKMKSVISFFITAINVKCGSNFNAEQIGTESTKNLEEKFQEVYDSLKA